MTDDERPAFGQAMAMLAETLNEAMSAARLEGYFQALRDLPLSTVRFGIEEALRTVPDFFPKPGKIRALACPVREPILNVAMYRPFTLDPLPPRPALVAPVEMAAVIAAAMTSIQTAVGQRREAEAPKPMSAEEVAARKALLREQAKRLLISEPEGEA